MARFGALGMSPAHGACIRTDTVIHTLADLEDHHIFAKRRVVAATVPPPLRLQPPDNSVVASDPRQQVDTSNSSDGSMRPAPRCSAPPTVWLVDGESRVGLDPCVGAGIDEAAVVRQKSVKAGDAAGRH